MKYKRVTEEILEDKKLFKRMSAARMSSAFNIDEGYLSKVKNNIIIPSEQWYLDLKAKVDIYVLDR